MNYDHGSVDCACVIHGTAYDWIYVDRLYNMLTRHVSWPVRLHVFTEKDRAVPAHMIHHPLIEWPGVAGPRKAWWYKLQLFRPGSLKTPILYLDLDTVIVGNLDWVWSLDRSHFWATRDFRYLWRKSWMGINSSMMFWNPEEYTHVWQIAEEQGIDTVIKRFRGDQDYLDSVIGENLRFFDVDFVKSWRWQIKDGGLDFGNRAYRRPGAGAVLTSDTRVVVFHGSPKPHEIPDSIIQNLWNCEFASED
jgi:hypothetical protein